MNNTWILQLEVIAVIKTFLSLSVCRECYQREIILFRSHHSDTVMGIL